MSRLFAQIVEAYPFVDKFVGEYRVQVDYAGVRLISAELLNSLASVSCDDCTKRSFQRNVYFLDGKGSTLYRVVPIEDEQKEENSQGPRGKSIGRHFLILPLETRQKVEYVLVQEWENNFDGAPERHHIDIVLYRSPSRYSLYEFVEELSDEVKGLHFDR